MGGEGNEHAGSRPIHRHTADVSFQWTSPLILGRNSNCLHPPLALLCVLRRTSVRVVQLRRPMPQLAQLSPTCWNWHVGERTGGGRTKECALQHFDKRSGHSPVTEHVFGGFSPKVSNDICLRSISRNERLLEQNNHLPFLFAIVR